MVKAILKVFVLSTIFSVCSILMMSCDSDNKKAVDKIEGDTRNTTLITLTANGESHEFVMYKEGVGDRRIMGMSHWPECKYCCKDSIE